MHRCPCTCSLCIILARAPAKWLPTASTLCSLGFSRKKAHEVGQGYAPKETQNDISENFLHMDGCFEPNTSCIQALGWVEKKEDN